MRSFLAAMTRNPVSLFGASITTASTIIMLTLFGLELVGFHGGPYIGILAYLILPAVFVLGLALIPLGIVRERRRVRRVESAGRQTAFPVIDLNVDRTRTIVMLFVLFSVVNAVILATATYKGVEVMDSNEFCGTTCHTVMQPEYTAYKRSPHARVKCVSCHIGPGAGWYAKSKLSGAWQVVSVAFDLYPRPIPTPVHNLRPARETCEQCHWPSKFLGDRLLVKTHFDEDEQNTVLKTALVLRVGGLQAGRSEGIHWHVDPGVEIRYRSDPTRETIYDVEMKLPDGTVKTFLPPDYDPQDAAEHAESEWRLMDCVDCHNRPTHIYRTPEQEVDMALVDARINRSLPFVRREGVRLLRQDYDDEESAYAGIREGLNAFYRDNYPDLLPQRAADIAQASEALSTIYASNVFPKMKVGWGTYPDHVGHEASPGCFRCHNDEHATADGETISQDCFTCHEVLAIGEENPVALSGLGVN